MVINGVIALGKDSEGFRARSGVFVLSFSGAYRTGYRETEETHWIKCTMFGSRAEALRPYLLKGTKLFINGTDPRVTLHTKCDGTLGVSFECVVQTLEFSGKSSQRSYTEAVEEPYTSPIVSQADTPSEGSRPKQPRPDSQPNKVAQTAPWYSNTGSNFKYDDIPF